MQGKGGTVFVWKSHHPLRPTQRKQKTEQNSQSLWSARVIMPYISEIHPLSLQDRGLASTPKYAGDMFLRNVAILRTTRHYETEYHPLHIQRCNSLISKQKSSFLLHEFLVYIFVTLTGKKKTKLNSVAVVRKRTIPTERPPLVGVSANLCG
jgi:hypothetical protein